MKVVILFFLLSTVGFAQFPCDNSNFRLVENILGQWSVETTDRIKPGEYQQNSGTMEIRPVFGKCGFEEIYAGEFKGQKYAFRAIVMFGDSTNVRKMWLDSQHGNFMLLEGEVFADSIVVKWQRELSNRTMQVKHVYRLDQSPLLISESYLLPRKGEQWQLTHKRTYRRR